jgi:hypothetical protein
MRKKKNKIENKKNIRKHSRLNILSFKTKIVCRSETSDWNCFSKNFEFLFYVFILSLIGDDTSFLFFLVLLGVLLALGALGLSGGGELLFAFVDDVLDDTLGLGEGDGDGLGVLADDEEVGDAGGEFVAGLVDDVGNAERTGVAFERDGAADTATVGTADEHDDGVLLELEGGRDLAGLGVDDEGVTALDGQGGVADAAAVVGDDDGDAAGGGVDVLDAAELDLGLGLADVDEGEAALLVVQHAEAFAGAGDFDDVLEASGVLGVDAGAGVDVDELLAEDHLRFAGVEGILEAVAENDGEGHALTELVGTSARAGSEDTGELGEHPVLGGEEALKMTLGTAGHFVFGE